MKPKILKPDELKPKILKPDELKPDELKPGVLKPGELKPGELKPGELVTPGEKLYSDEDIKELKDDLKKIADELNVNKIMMKNMLSDIDNYKQNRSHSFNLVKEKLLQDLEIKKRDIHRLKKKERSWFKTIKIHSIIYE